jgi:hypothetical protein
MVQKNSAKTRRGQSFVRALSIVLSKCAFNQRRRRGILVAPGGASAASVTRGSRPPKESRAREAGDRYRKASGIERVIDSTSIIVFDLTVGDGVTTASSHQRLL